jgi:hypothetical protein
MRKSALSTCFMCLAVLAGLATGVEVLVHTQDTLMLDNNSSMMIKDADAQAGIIWLKISHQGGLPESRVLKLGENYALNDSAQNFTLMEIYAGGGEDLVLLDINGTLTENRGAQVSSNETQAPSPPEASPNLGVGEAALALLASWGMRLRLFARRKA